MAQRFLSLEEAAGQLGISKERLSELREHNKVTGYKDGASWKFRAEAIDKMAIEGIPQIEPPPSDLALDIDDDLGLAADEPSAPEAPAPAEPAHAAAKSDLGLADAPPSPSAAAAASSDLSLDEGDMMVGPASDLSLEEEVDEPTVAGLDEGSDDALAIGQDDSIDLTTDSILLSEAELGESPARPPSTIIGKAELDLDADLDLSPLDKGGPPSDVKLASDSSLIAAGGSDLGLDLPSPSGNFEGLEELEVDLEAESSRILAPGDVAKARTAAKAAKSSKAGASSDLELAPTSSSPGIATSDIGVGKESGSGAGLTGLSALELDDEDEQVLGDGSDVTLASGSSGINIISPSDSGLALDEVPLDLSGSAPIGSSLDLGSAVGVGEEESSLDSMSLSGIGAQSKIGDFQLTPLGEEEEDEEKDSSQVIALDEISEETAGAPVSSTSFAEVGMGADEFGAALTPGAMPVAAAPGVDTPFSLWNVLSLAGCVIFLGLCTMMTYDLLRNIWNWDGVGKINSMLLEGLNPFLGR